MQYPPKRGANPSPLHTKMAPFHLHASLLTSIFVFSSLSLFLPSSLSLDLSWPVLSRFFDFFRPQLGPQNRPKSSKNRFQEAFYLGPRLLIGFWSIFGLNLDPQILKNRALAAATLIFCKIGSLKIASIFEPILAPCWAHFGAPIGSKIEKMRFQEASKICCFFGSIFFPPFSLT